jgi:hypothetical protein
MAVIVPPVTFQRQPNDLATFSSRPTRCSLPSRQSQ